MARKGQMDLRLRRFIQEDQNCSFKLSVQVRRIQIEVNSPFSAPSYRMRHFRNQQRWSHADLFNHRGCCAVVTECEVMFHNCPGQDLPEVETLLRKDCG